jgi:hypothetical protein
MGEEKAPSAEGALSESSAGCLENSEVKPPRQNTQVKKRGGRAPRQKGCRFELALVRLLQDAGLGAEKVARAGYSGGDLSIPLLGRDLVVEVKARANGFARLYSWLEGRNALIIKGDRRDALVVLPLRLAAEIAIAAERRKP